MLYSITATNPSRDSIALILNKPEASGFILLNATGLGPGKCDINVNDNASTRGGTFSSSRQPSRNIALSLRFLALPTIEETRLRSYRYFNIGSRIRLDIQTDAGLFYIYGYVESNEPSIFSPESGCVISILCPDPAFRIEDGLVTGDISAIIPGFRFPFSSNGTFNFGSVLYQSEMFPIECLGTSNVEPTIYLYAKGGAVNNPKLYFYDQNDPNYSEVLGIEFTNSLPALEDGDVLKIVCEKTNKSIIRIHSGDMINYIGTLAVNSSWPVLRPGINYFSYSAESGSQYIRVGYEYTRLYVGI